MVGEKTQMKLDEKAREAILRMMFGKSVDQVETYFPILLQMWGLIGKEENNDE